MVWMGMDKKEEIIEVLRKKSVELGHSPSQNDVGSKLVNRARHYFGSWNNAKKEAGLEITIRRVWSKEKVLLQIRDLAYKQGYSPRLRDAPPCLLQAAKKYFGSWNNAKQIIGLEVNCFKYHQKINDRQNFIKSDSICSHIFLFSG